MKANMQNMPQCGLHTDFNRRKTEMEIRLNAAQSTVTTTKGGGQVDMNRKDDRKALAIMLKDALGLSTTS